MDLDHHQGGLVQASFLLSRLSLYLQLSMLHISVFAQSVEEDHKNKN